MCHNKFYVCEWNGVKYEIKVYVKYTLSILDVLPIFHRTIRIHTGFAKSRTAVSADKIWNDTTNFQSLKNHSVWKEVPNTPFPHFYIYPTKKMIWKEDTGKHHTRKVCHPIS